MAAASDKARFYLEQFVPELQEYESKGIFSRAEITSITSKRSDFEHILNARGSNPIDYERYAEYEINLDTLRKKRCKRLGIKALKPYSGQRTVFFILDRGTHKFPGDMGLWMSYIRFCQREKANKKLDKVFTSLLRLMPREWGLWVLAAKWYMEEMGDVSTARSYMQRGLRFCKEERKLWLEYCKLEMLYLAKLVARRQILGIDEERKQQTEEEAVRHNEDENIIALPTVTAEEIDPDASKGIEEVDDGTLKRLANAPAFQGAIPIAIFDAAMKQFSAGSKNVEVAEDFFELVAGFESVPSAEKILTHVLEYVQSAGSHSAEAVICEARLQLFGLAADSVEFPAALGTSLARVRSAAVQVAEKEKVVLAEKAVLLLLSYINGKAELDEDVETVLVGSTNRYIRMIAGTMRPPKSAVVKALAEHVKAHGKLDAGEIRQLSREAVKGQG